MPTVVLLLACALSASSAHASAPRDALGGSPLPPRRRRMPPADAPLTADEIARVVRRVHAHYPNALREDEFVAQLHAELRSYDGAFEHATLVATSLCCDEVNRGLEIKLASRFGGGPFAMGGLAGFPFAGVAGFGAFAHHVPQPGAALVVYGPHVGVDADGVVGRVHRRGIRASSACCGAATGALDTVRRAGAKRASDLAAERAAPASPLDAQRDLVVQSLLELGAGGETRAAGVLRAPDPSARLPHALFDAQREAMGRIIEASAPANMPSGTLIAVVGGIHINTPFGACDYFLPLVLELRTSNGVPVRVVTGADLITNRGGGAPTGPL